jgi:hypothetical protein
VGVAAMGGSSRARTGASAAAPAARGHRRPSAAAVPQAARAGLRHGRSARKSVYDETAASMATDRPATTPRPRRATVPSWDEILFGTRTRTPD